MRPPSPPKKVWNLDGSYSWRIDYYEPDGKRVKKRFRKLADAEAWLAKVKVSKQEGTYEEIFGKKDKEKEKEKEKPYLFRDLAADYLQAYQGQKAFIDKKQIVGVLVQAFGEKALADINYRELELFRSKRESVPTWCGKRRTPARVNRELSILRHLFNKAVTWGKLPINPFSRGESLFRKENNERIRYLTQQEANDLLAACQAHLRPIVETAINTGMRKGEILTLKWSQVRDGWIYLEKTKSGKGRPVPVNNAQAAVFRELLGNAELKSPYVFSDEKGKPFNNVQKSFDSACRRAGVYDFRFHDLRHTCASWMVMAGVSLVVVQKQLGHASIKTTMRYAHLAPGHMKEAVNLIGTRAEYQMPCSPHVPVMFPKCSH